MDLWAKSMLIITLAVAAGLSGIFAVAGYVLIEDYKNLEEQAISQDLELVGKALDEDRLALEATVLQLSDLAQVLFDGNGTVDGNDTAQLFVSVFVQGGVEVVFAVTDNGTIGFLFDPSTFEFLPPPEELNRTLPGSPLLAPPHEARSGVLATSNGTFLLAARPLLGPALGLDETTVVAGYRLDEAYSAGLAAATQEDLRILLADESPDHPAWSEGVVLDRPDWGHLVVTVAYHDMTGQPAFLVRMEQPRDVFQQGIDTMTFFFYASIAIAIVFLVVGLSLIRFLVTGRVERLSRRMHDIEDEGDLSARVTLHGKDEVTRLADEFNGLMDRLRSFTRRLRETNEALHQSNEDLESFTRVVTHDLKSPLSTFMLNLEMIRRQGEKDGDSKTVERVARMQRSAKGMEERIDAILTYSRTRAEPADRQPVRLPEVLDGVIADLAADIQARDAVVEVEPLPVVRGDPRLLAQVFQNLVSNAVKYHRDGEAPRVRVSAEEDSGEWRIHVDDEGLGFREEDLEEIFQPFHRLESAKGRPGHGVGLASCARIMERLGGRLEAHGVPGEGARFTVVLPKGDPEPQP